MTMTQISLRQKTKEEADAKDEGSNTDKEDVDANGEDSIVSQVANWVGSLIILYCPSNTVERGLGIVLNN